MAGSRPRIPTRIPPASPEPRTQTASNTTVVESAHEIPPAPFAPLGSPLTPLNLDPTALAPAGLPSAGDQMQSELDNLANRFEQLHAQLRHAQKLASLGATAAVIAHEFNNLFTPIVAYGRQALDTGDVPLMRKALEKTLTQVEVMRRMSDRVIGMAKQSDTAIKPVNVAKSVENAIECLGRDLAKDNIAVQVQIDAALAVRTNESALLQVLFNLIINARQAMLGRRGRLTVDAARREDRVEINVRDSGCGIPPENLDRIFEPFFTTKGDATKPDRRGLGLGLAICRDIIEELNGQIRVASQVNVGTTFTLNLPAAD